jgi:NADPH2:quinone reductase
MKAVLHQSFGDSSVMEIGQPDDPVPGPGQVLVRVRAAAVNPIDWKIREGLFECIFEHRFPIIPGWDAAGEIAALGEGANRFAVGDKVYAYCRQPLAHEGAYAQYIRLPEAYPAGMPQGLDYAAAATIPLCALTGWQSLAVFGRVGEGDKVLMHAGAGGVGSLGIQIAKHLGALVITTTSAANADYCKGLGADEVIDYRASNYIDEIHKLVPEGLDMVFDAVGGSIPEESLQLIKPGGALACLNEAPAEGLTQARGIRACRIYAEADGKALADISALIEAGALRPPEYQTFPLEAAAQAMDLSQVGHVRGKLVLMVD